MLAAIQRIQYSGRAVNTTDRYFDYRVKDH
nr:MAG TPA: hypothetical protein [Caudoviricetes sp.]